MSRARDRADGDFAGKELIFDADGDTSITADTDDQIDIRIAGSDQIKIAAGEVAFNEASGDIDFRVESNGNANMINVDGGNDRVGIGISPSFNTQIDKSSTNTTLTDLTDAQLVLSNTGSATTNQHVKLGFRFQDGSVNGQAMIAAVRESSSARTSSLRFYSAPSSDGDPDERLSISGAGDVTVSTGNLVIGTSGKGIDFSATGDGSGTDSSELLDDYEEGTWTPTLTSGGSVSINAATYTKIGNIIRIGMYIAMSSIPNNNSAFYIGGLPYNVDFTSGGSNDHYHGAGSITYVGSHNVLGFGMLPPTPYTGQATMYFHRGDGSSSTVLNSNMTGCPYLILATSYKTA